MRASALVLCLVATPVLLAPAAAAARPAEGPRQALRCNPEAHRVIEPLVLEEGGEFTVRTHFDYACPEGTRPVVFVLAVENSDLLRPPGFGGGQVLGNVKDGLTAFIESIDFDNGSLGAMILYTTNPSVRAPMQGGDAGRSALLAAVNGIQPSGASARGAGAAVTSAAELLAGAQGPENAMKLLLLLDVGAELGDETDVLSACSTAAAAGVHISVVALRGAGSRLMECSVESSFRQSAREGAQDIPEKLGELGDGFVHGEQAEGVLLADTLVNGMDYVAGSAQPEPSSSFAGEMTWELPAPPPAGGQDVTYRIRPETVGGEQMLSVHAGLNMLYRDGTTGEIVLENPELCVHRRGHPEDCALVLPTATPTSASPTESPTSGPTEQPTATATATGVDSWTVYLPASETHR